MSTAPSRAGSHRDRLLALFSRPAGAERLSAADWSDIVATARNANLLGKLATSLEQAAQRAPEAPQRHLTGAAMLSARQRQSVIWEAHQINDALAPLGTPVVLLKGAAYAMAGHAAADGRLFGDIDLLVERDALGTVERQLMGHGWTPMKTDAYDQRYYRQWMHEIPPLVHARRGTVIDVHHTILPLTARHHPAPERIFRHAKVIPGLSHLMRPAPEDLIVHSLCHLAHEGEVDNLLRDLHDIASLLREQAADPQFQARLEGAAAEHDLLEPCALGLALAARYFGCDVTRRAADSVAARGGRGCEAALLALYEAALHPSPTGEARWTTHIARTRIYLRSHRLRMPPLMLFRHLSRKAWRRLTTRPESAPQEG